MSIEKHVKKLTGLGLCLYVEDGMVILENMRGITVHKLGDGFSLEQYDIHRYQHQDFEWVFLNGCRIARTPRNDWSIYTALKDLFLNYAEEDLESKYRWLSVADGTFKDVPKEVLKKVDDILEQEIGGQYDWDVGETLSVMKSKEISTFHIMSFILENFVQHDGVTFRIRVRAGIKGSHLTLHEVAVDIVGMSN